MRITITVDFTREYGHPGNRPSDSGSIKRLHDELDKLCDAAASKTNGLSGFYVTGLKVTE